ncbi:MAG: riboflavin synthase [Candidatus Latescibacterota bacterium]|nr:riboflavin synthase [Candidatus Latescibacterota bacterium]
MFTGIVEEVGDIKGIDQRSNLQRTTVGGSFVLEGTEVGDSISINGACHTVVSVEDDCFAVESVVETLNRTTTGDLRVGDRVNLERSVRLSDRLDGHLVQGHVDGIGKVIVREVFDDNVNFTFEVDSSIARYIAEKGSVAIDGISLTVVSLCEVTDRGQFSVTIIPHTLSVTALQDRHPGDRVNIEIDVIARYVERLIQTGSLNPNGLTWSAIESMGYNC